MKQCNKCEPFETGFIANCTDKTNCIYGSTNKVWDDKFGLMDKKAIIAGVGEDAEVVVNAAGGKQSKSPLSLHLFDAGFLFYLITEQYQYSDALDWICGFMNGGDKDDLIKAVDALEKQHNINAIKRISEVLEYGAKNYAVNNWRLIPQEEHLNHALVHLYASLTGDTQDDHIGHCMCRLMMAHASEKSNNFDYAKFIPAASK